MGSEGSLVATDNSLTLYLEMTKPFWLKKSKQIQPEAYPEHGEL